MDLFYEKYKTFDWKFYVNIYDDLKKAGITTEKKAKWHYYKNGCKENRRITKIINKPENIYKVPFENFTSIAKQCYFSEGVLSFKSRICKKYNLIDYNNKYKPCLFFGMYNDNDLKKIKNHLGLRIIIWCGSDSNISFKHSKQTISEILMLQNIIHISKSLSTLNSLKLSNINSILVDYNVVDKTLFYPIPKNKLGKSIFIFNGQHKGREHVYGAKFYKEVIKLFPNIHFIFSNKLNLKWEEMPNIYKKCFIMLRLTSHDGNANSVQECQAMNIPVVHNQSDYGLKWNSVNDIIKHIKNYI